MGKFVVKNTATGVKFDLKASNGEIIATSEVYTNERNCMKGVASVQRNAPKAAVEDQTVENFETKKHPKFEIYADKKGELRFRLKSRYKHSDLTGRKSCLCSALGRGSFF